MNIIGNSVDRSTHRKTVDSPIVAYTNANVTFQTAAILITFVAYNASLQDLESMCDLPESEHSWNEKFEAVREKCDRFLEDMTEYRLGKN